MATLGRDTGRCRGPDRTGRSDLLHTALRELQEECGIILDRESLETALPLSHVRRRAGPILVVVPFVLRVEHTPPAVPDLQEAVEATWVPLSLLRDPARHALRPVPGMSQQMLFPAIDLPGPPLWGFTYRLLAEWLGLIPQGRPIAEAGLQAADDLLKFLLARAFPLVHGWEDRDGVKVAAIEGAIPVDAILGQLAVPAVHIPHVNWLELNAEQIRVVGLGLEEYVIQTQSPAPADTAEPHSSSTPGRNRPPR